MYIRTTSRTNKDGSKVSYFQMVENYWDKKKRRSQTRVVCSLGRVNEENSNRLRQLAASIRKRLSLEELGELEG